MTMTMTMTIQTSLFLSCLTALSACGGGGGGSGVASAPIVPPPVVPVVPVPVPVPWQGTHMTVTYDVDSASATVVSNTVTGTSVDAAGSGSTVTVRTNSVNALNDRIIVSFNVATPGARFVNVYPPDGSNLTSLPTLSLSQLSAALLLAYNNTGANGFVAQAPDLSYSAYGVWATNDTGTAGRIGAIGIGTLTPIASVPTTGSASYVGTTNGAGINAAGPFALTGAVQIGVNFASGAVSTAITGVQQQNITTNVVSAGASLSGTGTVSGNRLSSTLAGGGTSGVLAGSFYGPAAQEVAGAWRVTGSGSTSIGGFGAKR